MPSITVQELFEDNKERLQLELLNNDSSFQRTIEESDLNRPALALTGFVDVFTYRRVQIMGNTEHGYLSTLTSDDLNVALDTLTSFELPCIVVTENNDSPKELIAKANKQGISIFRSPLNSSRVIHLLTDYMDDKFSPSVTMHGSMVDVYGIGVLFTGRSGIGKSEIALDLVERGHRLVADDVVNIARKAESVLIGTASEVLQHHMEIRGLGIIDVRSIFGIRAIRLQKRVEVVVHLEEWDDEEDYERIGLDETTMQILGVAIPLIKLPIFPGKNITVIAEVVAMNQLLKIHGLNPALEFNERLLQRIQENAQSEEYLQGYLDKDFE